VSKQAVFRTGNPQIPSFINAHHMTHVIPATFSLQGHPNRGTTPEDEERGVGIGKEDMEKLTRADSRTGHSVWQATPKVSQGDGYQQLSSSPFVRYRPLFPCPDLLETSRLMKPLRASPRL